MMCEAGVEFQPRAGETAVLCLTSDDLSRRPESIPSPQWHGALLAERIAAVREGRATFVDWDSAKKRLRDRVG